MKVLVQFQLYYVIIAPDVGGKEKICIRVKSMVYQVLQSKDCVL